MRILASIIVIIGLLNLLGGVAGLIGGNPNGTIRLVIGLALIGVAFLIKPKKPVETVQVLRRRPPPQMPPPKPS